MASVSVFVRGYLEVEVPDNIDVETAREYAEDKAEEMDLGELTDVTEMYAYSYDRADDPKRENTHYYA